MEERGDPVRDNWSDQRPSDDRSSESDGERTVPLTGEVSDQHGATGQSTVQITVPGDDRVFIDNESSHIFPGEWHNHAIYEGFDSDRAFGGSVSDTYVFYPFDATDTFDNDVRGGWTDEIRLSLEAEPGAPVDHPWTIAVDEQDADYVVSDRLVTLKPDPPGAVTLADGSELEFSNVKRIVWKL